MYVGFHLHESRSSRMCGTVAEGFAQLPKATEDVQVQLSAQLCQLHPHYTVPPHHPLLTLPTHTHVKG